MRSMSGTIATGGVSQVLSAASTGRRGYSVQNISTGDLWVNDLGEAAAAVQPSIRLPSGAHFETPPGYVPAFDISIFGAVTGQAFVGREW